MKMTLRQFEKSYCLNIVNSLEAQLRAHSESGIQGTGFNEDGEPVFSDGENELLLEDVITFDNLAELQYRYKELEPSVVESVYRAFRLKYTIVSLEDYKKMFEKSKGADIVDMSYWDSLVDGASW